MRGQTNGEETLCSIGFIGRRKKNGIVEIAEEDHPAFICCVHQLTLAWTVQSGTVLVLAHLACAVAPLAQHHRS